MTTTTSTQLLARLLLPLALLLLVSTGCADEGFEPLTKEAAAEQQGKADSLIDFCAENGWYGDGICDEFCLLDDPDCGGECHPADDYVLNDLGSCAVAKFFCDPGEVYFADACGCGCTEAQEPEPEPSCHPEDDYVINNPDTCAVAKFTCEPGTEYFADECGCGCAPVAAEPDACPNQNNPQANYLLDSLADCAVSLIQCEPGQQYFVESCGCGCIAP